MPAPHPPDPSRVRVIPRLDGHELRVLRELAWEPGRAHRIWVGQPGRRCPWTPCDRGCCLLLARPDPLASSWLALLVHEVLAPRSAAGVARAAAVGLTRTHRVEGEAARGALSGRGSVARVERRPSRRGEVVQPDPGPPDGPDQVS